MVVLHVKSPNGTQKDVDIDKIVTTDGATMNGNLYWSINNDEYDIFRIQRSDNLGNFRFGFSANTGSRLLVYNPLTPSNIGLAIYAERRRLDNTKVWDCSALNFTYRNGISIYIGRNDDDGLLRAELSANLIGFINHGSVSQGTAFNIVYPVSDNMYRLILLSHPTDANGSSLWALSLSKTGGVVAKIGGSTTHTATYNTSTRTLTVKSTSGAIYIKSLVFISSFDD